jgi:hypothetical protein
MKSFAFALLFFATMTQACPLCRDSVDASQAAGFNGSVEWMLGGLVFVVGTLGVRVWRSAWASLRDSR